MKAIIVTVFLVVFAVAEPPPSNSYLPPTPSGGRAGYPRGGPNLSGSGVIAARSQGLTHGQGHEHGDEHGHEDHFQASPNGLEFGRGAQNAQGQQVHGYSSQLHGHSSQPHGHNSAAVGRNSAAQGHNIAAHGHNSAAQGHNSAAHGHNSPHGQNSSPHGQNSPHAHDHSQHGHNSQVASGRFSQQSQGYDQNASPFGRNGESSSEPASYNFEYAVSDFVEGTDFGHHEERQDARAEGEYHVVLPDGRRQTVSYEADERGFKPHISYEDTDAVSRSNGYDANANNLHGNQGFKNSGRNHGNGY